MVAKRSKAMKVTTREERDRKSAERLKNGEYFEKYMIEIGQWKRTPKGVEICGNHAERIHRKRIQSVAKPKKK